MASADLTDAIAACRNSIGSAHVLTQPEALLAFTRNLGGEVRTIPLVLRPACTSEVQALVAIANTYHLPLYPVSCGRNWGLGSRLPVRDGSAVLDLSRLQRITEVNVPYHYAIVEPGVSQGQLYDHIRERGLPLMINITGAGRQTSLIGNALDRGIGYFASRADALCALEVVLGTGEVIQTGHAHYAQAKTAHIYRHGTGPSLDGLFSQSNFGIVTRATVDLMPIPECSAGLLAKINDEARFAALVDRLGQLRVDGSIRTVVHIGDRGRSHITLAPLLSESLARANGGTPEAYRDQAESILERERFGAWTALIGVSGSQAMVQAACGDIRRRLADIADVMVMTDKKMVRLRKLVDVMARFSARAREKRAVLEAMEPLFGMAAGIPTDAPLKSLYWPLRQQPSSDPIQPDADDCGMLYCLPFLPLSGADALQVLQQTRRIFGQFGFEPYMTFNIIDTKALELVVNLAFDRRDAQRRDAAQRCIETLTAQCVKDGYIPYRVGIEAMPHILQPADGFWQTVREMKKVFDPNNIIAPGRYNLV